MDKVSRSDFSAQLKQQADMVAIVGESVKLRKSGANWTGLCPFHGERSASFFVYPESGSFYCFGCRVHGDVYTFLGKMNGLSFPEAVDALADKLGIRAAARQWDSPEEAAKALERRRLMDVYEAATQYFQGSLQTPEGARAREYISSRGLSPETVKLFRIGYAPDSFNDMRERLVKFFPADLLHASGLFHARENGDGSKGQMFAHFRKRVMFPILDESGKTIAFTGRLLNEGDARAGGKYVNSPETPLYTKGKVLYNLDKAKPGIRVTDSVILVEGQTDCITAFSAGVGNVLASSGTALTEHQVRIIGRLTKRVVLNFDGDDPGMKAVESLLVPFIEQGFEIKVAMLPGREDPDSFIRRQGVPEYLKLLRNNVPWTDYLTSRAQKLHGTDTAEKRVRAVQFVLPYLQRIPNLMLRTEMADQVARQLGVDSAAVLREVRSAVEGRKQGLPTAAVPDVTAVERTLLRALVLPTADPTRVFVVAELVDKAEWFDGLASASVFTALMGAHAIDNPFDLLPDDASRSLLATALQVSGEDAQNLSTDGIKRALGALQKRYVQRRERSMRSERESALLRGDHDAVRRLRRCAGNI